MIILLNEYFKPKITFNEYLNFCVFYIHLSISMWKHKIVDRCFLT